MILVLAWWSCLVGVGLIRPGLPDDGIKALMLCAFDRSSADSAYAIDHSVGHIGVSIGIKVMING